jgi:aspartate/methionine/tyrosine aminotransferase
VPDAFVEATEKLAQNIFIATSSLSQYAALAAFDEQTIKELERRKAEFSVRRDFLYDNLRRIGFEVPIKPQGAFYIYADCSKFTNDSFRFAQELLEAEAVAVTPGKDFGTHHSGHYLRFAYTTSVNKMATAMQRLENFLNQRSLCR